VKQCKQWRDKKNLGVDKCNCVGPILKREKLGSKRWPMNIGEN